MQKRVRAVIVQDGKVLTIKRIKNNEAYFVFPGGGVDDGEDNKSALVRECLEEINVSVSVADLIFKQVFNQNEELFYLCDIVSGAVGHGHGEEYKKMSGNNYYEPTWLSLVDIKDNDIRPGEIINVLNKIKI
ncbi:NUDIX domain-containing protein [Candidatus Parcubacteria bacterium]|nr:NUDIX domain-containing protein [Patescibacteria group bacterium]MBU4309325.1 NUDIX domain-containing protein [Patescibacteria group bacterium]MBU4432302.1 NUDIX domain-containing protein [Patescibacteria group bacterium]MBU4577686.1 NUDIX domain-containing protein [Patescibacteria group bacterium]MCG2697372.1 NUDIX domain-containing protein [Candidatus Parcubacteria bacterium]